MQHPASLQEFTLLLRAIIARHRNVPVASVSPCDELQRDHRIDPLGLAFITLQLEDATGLVDLAIPDVDGDITVTELASRMWPTVHRPLMLGAPVRKDVH